MADMTVVRQNTGNMVTGQQPNPAGVTPEIQALIDQMVAPVTRFRDASTPLMTMINLQNLQISQTTSFRVQSTGLGQTILHKVYGSISLVNGAGAPQAVSFAKEFPYNLITNISTMINGQVAISSASAFGYLKEMARRYRSISLNPLNSAICSVTAGANVTLTSGANSVSGYTGASIGASSTGVINFVFYVETPYVWNLDSMIGLLPLQNSSTYAEVSYQMANSMLGTTAAFPIYVSGSVPGTLSYDASGSSISSLPRYDFWAVPQNAALYQPFIMNSFQILEQFNFAINADGVGAIQFQYPLNSFLLSNTLTIRNASNALVDCDTVVQNIYQQYNSNIYPFKTNYGIHKFDQYLFGQTDYSKFGTIVWDGTATGQQVNVSDETGWINLYTVSNPTFLVDINTGSMTLPGTYSIQRASIVPADVRVVPQQ